MKLQLYRYPGEKTGWLLIGKIKICWRDKNDHPLRFSERQKITKYIIIGKWILTLRKGLNRQ